MGLVPQEARAAAKRSHVRRRVRSGKPDESLVDGLLYIEGRDTEVIRSSHSDKTDARQPRQRDGLLHSASTDHRTESVVHRRTEQSSPLLNNTSYGSRVHNTLPDTTRINRAVEPPRGSPHRANQRPPDTRLPLLRRAGGPPALARRRNKTSEDRRLDSARFHSLDCPGSLSRGSPKISTVVLPAAN